MTKQHRRTSDDSIGSRARRAAGWQFLSKGINTSLQMLTAIILARLLMPADFGIIAMSAMVTGLADVFRDLGLGQALVQRREISPDHIRSAFWGTLLMACLLYAGMFFAAPYVGSFFGEPRMVLVLRISALSFVLSPFAVVPRSLLQRDLDFKTQFFAGLASSASYGAVGITMAVFDYGYWALVGAALAGAAMSTVALCILTRYLPPLIPSLRGVGDLYGFGVGVTAIGLVAYLRSQVDYLVIGRRLDATALGNYRKAFEMSVYPSSLTSRVLHSVLFPAFSKLRHDLPRLRKAFGRILTTVSAAGFPVLALVAVSAPELIPVVLGDQWEEAIIPTQIMCVVGAVSVIANPGAALVKGLGEVYSLAWRQALSLVVLAGAAWWGAGSGVAQVALAVSAANLLCVLPLQCQLVASRTSFGVRDYAHALRGPMVCAALTACFAFGARLLCLHYSFPPPLVATLTIGAGLSAAGLSVLLLPFTEYRYAIAQVRLQLRSALSIGRTGQRSS